VSLAFATDARGVDQPEIALGCLQHSVDRVARRACDWRHDDALLTKQSIEQRRLSDIWPADNGQPQLARCGLLFDPFLLSEPEQVDRAVEQFTDTDSLLRGDRKHVVKAEAKKLSAFTF